jgi:hypothetical protein
MTNLECPNCGRGLTVMRSGKRATGASLTPEPIDTVAFCEACNQTWEREHGDQSRWRLPGRLHVGWDVIGGPILREAAGGTLIATYRVAKGDDERTASVELSGSLRATGPDKLDDEYLAKAVETNGASCLYRVMATGAPPETLKLHTRWLPV